MKNFLKTYRSLIVRLFAIQLGSTFLGLILSFSTMKNELVYLCASVFCIIFYSIIAYTVANEAGLKDQIRIDGQRLNFSSARGFAIGACANFLNIILGIVTVIGKLCINNIGFFQDGRDIVASPAWAGKLFQIPGIICEFLQAMYLGFNSRFLSGNALIFLFMPAFSVLVIGVGYLLGEKGWVGLFTGEAKKKNK